MIRCLHICNGFLGNKVYQNLYMDLNKLGVKQCVYASLHKKYLNKEISYDFEKIILSDLLSFKDKIFFKRKINIHFNKIINNIDINTLSISHATTLFTDGAIAYKLWVEFKIPYIVTIRGTDINVYFKYRWDLYPLVYKILKNAERIVFVAESLKISFFQSPYIRLFKNSILNKVIVIPNPIDKYWHQNLRNKPEIQTIPSNILYIGRFPKQKNLMRLITAFLKLHKIYPNLKINFVGKGGTEEPKIIEMSKTYKGIINYIGFVEDKNVLLQIIRENHIFAMPSFNETFGLVYIEALSQGLPILFSRNTGVDKLFGEENVGEGVNPSSTNSIYNGLNKIISNYSDYNFNKLDFRRFDVESIAQKYLKVYKEIIE